MSATITISDCGCWAPDNCSRAGKCAAYSLPLTNAKQLPEASPLDGLTAAMTALTHYGIPPDIQELLIHGNPDRNIAPGALAAALCAGMRLVRTVR